MIKKIHNFSLTKKAFIFSALSLLGSNIVHAQTVTLYRTGVIVLPTHSTVASAIAASIAGDSIVLSPNVFKENNLVISHHLKITGKSDTNSTATIDAELKNRAILINTGDVTIDNVTIKNGKINNSAGGGVCNFGTGILTITGNSIISNNSCSGIYALGGGVYSAGKLFLLGNTKVMLNSSTENGGGVYAYSTFGMYDNSELKNNKTDGSGGGVFAVQNGALNISDFAKIENNTAAVAGGGIFGVGTFSRHASVSNNKADMGGGIAAFNDAIFLEDTVNINSNIASTSGAGIWLNNCTLYGHSSFQISNNTIPAITGTTNFGGAIYNVNGTILINGGAIIGNKSPVAAIYNTSSTTGKQVKIFATHIYNPKADGNRMTEVFNSPSLTSSIIVFESDSCYWGSNDTSKLVANKPGTFSGAIGSFVKLTWLLNNGLPIDTLASGFPLSADFRMDDGSKIDSLRLRTITGHFSASNGSFTPTISSIDTDNYVRSLYIAPAANDSIMVMAYVDADTFRSTKIKIIGLDVKEKFITNDIKIYPNPTSDYIFVKAAPKGATISIYSLVGALIDNVVVENNLTQINVSSLAVGTYILQIKTANGESLSSKIIKQ